MVALRIRCLALALSLMAIGPVAAHDWGTLHDPATMPSYHLVQVGDASAVVPPEEFQSLADSVRSCDDAKALALDPRLRVVENQSISAASIPTKLASELADLPNGRATQIAGAEEGRARFWVVCERFAPLNSKVEAA